MLGQIYGDILRRTLTKCTYLTLSRKLYETHYEILNLPTNATSREIKEAFIRLSKQHHPDLNKSSVSHKKFLRINEAYEILSKSDSRRNYDLGLFEKNPATATYHTEVRYKEQMENDPWKDPTFWANRDKSKDEQYKNRSYYGIDGVNRLPNSVIVFICILLTFTGVGLQFLAITKSFTLQREELIKKSMEAENSLRFIRNEAQDNGNDLQIKIMKMKLLANNKKD